MGSVISGDIEYKYWRGQTSYDLHLLGAVEESYTPYAIDVEDFNQEIYNELCLKYGFDPENIDFYTWIEILEDDFVKNNSKELALLNLAYEIKQSLNENVYGYITMLSEI